MSARHGPSESSRELGTLEDKDRRANRLAGPCCRAVKHPVLRWFISRRCSAGRHNRNSCRTSVAEISAKDHFMKQGYLGTRVRAARAERCVKDDLNAIQQVLGCTAIEHGTTFHTEDQLLISGDELNGAPSDRFWVAGVPFPFSGNALLVGIDPATGDIADRPVMAIDEFRRLVMFSRSSDCGRLGSAPHGAPNSCVDQRAR